MSNWKIHLFFGFIITLLGYFLLYKFNQFNFYHLLFIPYILFASISPDIDHPKSKARKIIKFFIFLSLITFFILTLFNKQFFYFILIPLILLFIIERLRHRSNLTHSVLFGILISFPLLFINFYLPFIVFASFLSHLILDF